jgi:hypothetical protein
MIEGRKPVTSNAAYRLLAIAILGFDSATLTSDCQDRRALDRHFQYALTTGAPLRGAESGSLKQSAISKVG